MLLIEKADLAKDIDFLQSERIDDDEKRATTEGLIHEIFGSDQQSLAAIEQRCRIFPQELKSLVNEVDALRQQADVLTSEVTKARLGNLSPQLSWVWDDALKPLVSRYEGWQEEEKEKIVTLLTREHEDTRDRFEFERTRIVSAWKSRLLWIGIAGIVTITLGFATYYKFGSTVDQQSLSEIVVWDAAGNALWALIVLIVRRARSDPVELLSRTRSDFFWRATLGVSRPLREREIGNPTDLSDVREDCRRRLSDDLTGVILRSSHQMKSRFLPLAGEVESVRINGLEIVNSYRQNWEDGRQIIAGLYQETDEKVARFKAVATTFKERTIDRTRQLFGSRGSELEEYIVQLEEQVKEMQQAQ
jgi:hypothetical protein